MASSLHAPFPAPVALAAAALARARAALVIVGAGVSTAAGIPDFRTPHDGLHAALAAAGVAEPQEVFDARVFAEEPELFWSVAHVFLNLGGPPPRPTRAHAFLASLEAAGALLRVFSQNVDALEVAAGVPAARVIAAHGDARAVRCARCARRGGPAAVARAAAAAAARTVPRCDAPRCGGALRPDVVFFHEPLGAAFAAAAARDTAAADLVLVVGTSLAVAPLNALHERVARATPRVFVNRVDVPRARGAAFDARLLGDADDILDALAAGGAPPAGLVWRSIDATTAALERVDGAAGSGGDAGAGAGVRATDGGVDAGAAAGASASLRVHAGRKRVRRA
jgi:NAD-dependent histone deacetylase SIR2